MKELMAHTEARGVPLSKEQVKEHAYIAAGHWEYKSVFGQWKVVAKRTPKTAPEFEKLLEAIRCWAAQPEGKGGLGLEIYLPNEGIKYPAWTNNDIGEPR